MWSNKQSPSQANYHFFIQTSSLTEQSLKQPIKLTNRCSILTPSICLFSLIPHPLFYYFIVNLPSFFLYSLPHFFPHPLPYIIFTIFPRRISSLLLSQSRFPSQFLFLNTFWLYSVFKKITSTLMETITKCIIKHAAGLAENTQK